MNLPSRCLVCLFHLTAKITSLSFAKIMRFSSFFKILLLATSILLPSGWCSAATVKDLIKQGDAYDLKFKPTDALKCYLPAEQMEPENVDLLLRIARQYRHQTQDVGSMKEKLRLSGLSLNYAKRAVALAPRNSEANLSVAICHAKAIELYGNKEKMEALRQVKSFADKALSLDSGNDLAWYILGRWHQRVAELSGFKRKLAEMAFGKLPNATNDDAAKCYRKAIQINPNRSPYYVDMGITCAAMENDADARKYIEKGLSLPSNGKDDPATKIRGKETLKTLH